MLRIHRTTLTILVIALVAITLIGTMVGAFMAFIPGSSDLDSRGDRPVAPTTQTETPPPNPTPTPDPRTAAVNGISLTLTDIRKSAEPKGVEVVIELSNGTRKPMEFAFFPQRDLSLNDNMGSNYNFRWAEYAGEVKVEAGQKTRLVRSFFAGPDREVTPEHLTLSLAGVPQFGRATWEIDWPGSSAKPTLITAATPATTPESEKPNTGAGSMITKNKISLTLVGADFNSELGGLLVTIAILNNTTGELSFPFLPERSMSVVDNRGGRFNLRWAEYAGNVRVITGQQVQLVKAFFDGPVADPLITDLDISVSNIPEFEGATWKVPVRR